MSNKFKIGKGIEPKCEYCEFSVQSSDESYLCRKKGLVDSSGCCGKYKYDITKRVPNPRPVMSEHDESEFIL